MRLIEPVSRITLESRIAGLDELARRLGKHHDLALLLDLLISDSIDIDSAARESLLATSRERQQKIGKRVRKAGGSLFEAPTDRFVDELFRDGANGARSPAKSAHGP